VKALALAPRDRRVPGIAHRRDAAELRTARPAAGART